MGRTLHEVFCIREVRDHRTGGTVVALNPPDTGSNRDPRSTFYDWYSRYQEGGIEALVDGKPRPQRIWNKIPDKIETAIVNLALEEPDLSPRELAINFTDTQGSFVSIVLQKSAVMAARLLPRSLGTVLTIRSLRSGDAGSNGTDT